MTSVFVMSVSYVVIYVGCVDDQLVCDICGLCCDICKLCCDFCKLC